MKNHKMVKALLLLTVLSSCSLPRLVKNDPTATLKPNQPTPQNIATLPHLATLPPASQVVIPAEMSGVISVGEELLAETFDHQGLWNIEERTEYGAEVEGGVYRMTLNNADYLIWSESGQVYADDVVLDVDTVLTAGSQENTQGMICRYQDADNFYAFSVGNDGWVEIMKVYQGQQSVIFGEFVDNLVDPAVNHLQAFCVGSRLVFYVNGVLGADMEDSDLLSGDVGLIIGSYTNPQVTVEFDNFTVFEATSLSAD